VRRPSLWFVIPTVAAAIIGAVVGWRVAYVSCSVDPDAVAEGTRGCLGTEIAFGTLGAVVAFLGVGVVMVLAIRSLAEWREAAEQGRPPPEVGCESEPVEPMEAEEPPRPEQVTGEGTDPGG
jgi:hypothetical protein